MMVLNETLPSLMIQLTEFAGAMEKSKLKRTLAVLLSVIILATSFLLIAPRNTVITYVKAFDVRQVECNGFILMN